MNYSVSCPEHAAPLEPAPVGVCCPSCNGVMLGDDELPGAPDGALLEQVTDPNSEAFHESPLCSACGSRMAPYRIAGTAVYVHRCGGCEQYWFPRGAMNSFERAGSRRIVQSVYEDMSEPERAELAGDLADVASEREQLTAVQFVLAMCGVPFVTGVPRVRPAFATLGIASMLVAVYLWQRSGGLEASFAAVAYRAGHDGLFDAVVANFAHAGALHLAGNLAFLFAFGDCVEQRLGSAKLLAAFLLLGTLSISVQGLVSPEAAILGASGGIAGLVGLAVVLTPSATVHIGFGIRVPVTVPIPMIAFALLELLYQGMMMLGGPPGAWTAHFAGLAAGILAGLVARFGDRSRPD